MGDKFLSSVPATNKKENRIVWVDCEMTGLDVNTEHMLEVACLITEEDLTVVEPEGVNIIIDQPDDVLANMNPWCVEQHGKSGLTAQVRASKINVKQAEQLLLDYVTPHTVSGKSPLAGNTVHMDRTFLRKYMPSFDAQLHYRIIDVSTVKELCWWNPYVSKRRPLKGETHRALDDIKESIQELKYYKENFFRC